MSGKLEIQGLSKDYGGVRALRNVSLSIHPGEFVAVIGRSGAGKSTLLRCVNRLVEPSSGRIVFDGEDVLALNSRLLRAFRTRVGMVFQQHNLISRQTVAQNVLHGRLGFKNFWQGVLGLTNETEKQRAWDLLVQLDLEAQVHQRCDRLSGGQKQRVGIARALLQGPQMLLCDEPIASVDPRSAKIIMDHLRGISEASGITVLCNLHRVDVARHYADRIIGIREGEVEYDGPPQTLDKDTVARIYGSDSEDLLVEDEES